MKHHGRARRELIASLVPPGRHIIDVGADHGHVAAAVGARIATERQPHRRGRSDVTWVVADGLAPFREVDVAIIAGMGAVTILGILARGPLPHTLIAHAPDDPQRLRRDLAATGWRIQDEGLAPEGRRCAEVLRVVRGTETHTGLELEYGPLLLQRGHALLVPHLTQQLERMRTIVRDVGDRAPQVRDDALRRAAFLQGEVSRRTGQRTSA